MLNSTKEYLFRQDVYNEIKYESGPRLRDLNEDQLKMYVDIVNIFRYCREGKDIELERLFVDTIVCKQTRKENESR